MIPETRLLRAFVAVAEERSFTRAAARLHVAQQAVSAQIRQLERELGVELLRRTTRHVEPTAAGEVFLADARAALAHLERAAERARLAAAGDLGDLRVAYLLTARSPGAAASPWRSPRWRASSRAGWRWSPSCRRSRRSA